MSDGVPPVADTVRADKVPPTHTADGVTGLVVIEISSIIVTVAVILVAELQPEPVALTTQ